MGKFSLPKSLLIIDVETSGTSPNASIIQLGVRIFKKEGYLDKQDYFNCYIRPYTLEWSKEAQKIHRLTEDFLARNGLFLEEAINAFEEWASKRGLYNLKKKYYLAQWSCGFDTNMLQNAYTILKKEYPFHYRSFDVASIIRFELAKRGQLLKKCGEDKCAKILGIQVDNRKLHDGLYDATLSGLMLERIVKEG